jgi:hypothetical protein
MVIAANISAMRRLLFILAFCCIASYIRAEAKIVISATDCVEAAMFAEYARSALPNPRKLTAPTRMHGDRSIRAEILLVGRDPISGDIALCRR